MNTPSIQTVGTVVVLLCTMLGTGCSERQTSLSQPTQSQQTVNPKPDPAVIALEAQVGMTFPTNTVLLDATDGGGRDSSHGFYAWGLFSPTAIKMPPMKAVGVEDYLILPLDNTVRFVQGMMAERTISQAQAAFCSE